MKKVNTLNTRLPPHLRIRKKPTCIAVSRTVTNKSKLEFIKKFGDKFTEVINNG